MDALKHNNKPKVLIVDDEIPICKLIQKNIENQYDQVMTAYSAEEALSTLNKNSVDVMVTDIRLPGMDGIELLKRARAIQEDLETIVITGYAEMDCAVEALRLGASNFFVKPLHMNLLNLSIQEALNKKRTRQQLRESEARFRKMFEMHGAAMLLIDPETADIVNANHSAAAFYGYDRIDDLTRLNMSRICLLPREKLRSEMQKALAGRQDCRVYRNRLKSGEIRTVEVYSSPVEIEEKQFLFSVINDVTERKRTQEALCRRLVIEEMVADISSSLVNARADQLDQSLEKALKMIGAFVDADRCFISLFAEEARTLDRIREWRADDMSPRIAELEKEPVEISAWAYEQFQKSDSFCVTRLRDLPNEAARDRIRWERWGMRALFTVPIRTNGTLLGIFGISSIHENREWPQESIGLLKMVGEMVSNALVRKRAEEELKESEKRYRDLYHLTQLITDNVPDMIWAKDMEDRYIFANQSICDRLIMCESPDEAIGETDIHFAERERNRGQTHTFGEICVDSDKITREAKTPGRFLEDGYVRGEYLMLDVHKAPLLNHEGVMIGTVGCGRDVTREKQIESELKNNREKLELAIEAATDSIWEWDILQDHAWGTTKITQILDTEPDHPGNFYDEWKNRLHPEDFGDVLRKLEDHLAGNTGLYEAEYRIQNRVGEWVWLLSRGKVSERDEQGKPLRMVGTNLDITRRKQIEEEIIHAKIFAEQANRAKTEFLANMSHEIRTPISGILGGAKMMLNRETETTRREELELMKSSAETLLKIVNETLDFSKIEAGKFQLKKEDFDLYELLDGVKAFFATAIQKKGLAFGLRIDSEVPKRFWGDPDRLKQVLLNLIGNGVKFTRDGEIRVEVERISGFNGSRLRFFISDTGVGIPSEDIPSLFQAFSQLDVSYSKQFAGTGLGLAISQKFVQMMGGEIHVESSPGMGSTFYFTIELEEPRAPEAISNDSIPNEMIPKKTSTDPDQPTATPDLPAPLRILLAEDDPLNRLSMVHFLENEGHQVTTAGDGKAVLEALAENTFDITLMDIQMPVLDGLETTRRIRGDQSGRFDPAHPVIALTAYAMDGDRDRIMEVGMDGYITKPVDLDELRRAIQNAVRKEEIPAFFPSGKLLQFAQDPIREIQQYIRKYQKDPPFLEEMLVAFRKEALERVLKSKKALAGDNIPEAAKAAHSLVSVLGAVRISSLATEARETEQCLRKGDLKKAGDSLDHLEEKIGEVIAYLASEFDK